MSAPHQLFGERVLAEQRPWFGQLSLLGRGPDWFCDLRFVPAASAALLRFVRDFALHGFSPDDAPPAVCPIHGGTQCSFASYSDVESARVLVANRANHTPANIYIYHSITVCGSTLRIERGYGGHSPACSVTETLLLRALAQHPDLALTSWAIWGGGQGYQAQPGGEGSTATDLLRYLDTARMA